MLGAKSPSVCFKRGYPSSFRKIACAPIASVAREGLKSADLLGLGSLLACGFRSLEKSEISRQPTAGT
jgi:hypothetical protein